MHDLGTSGTSGRRRWVPVVRAGLVIILLLTVGASLRAEDAVARDVEYTRTPLSDQPLDTAHDELIMLIISLVVIFVVIAGFEYIRQLPFYRLLLASFGAVVLSAFCTLVEAFVLAESLNYIEHLAFAAASILLAVWCGRVFRSKKQENR